MAGAKGDSDGDMRRYDMADIERATEFLRSGGLVAVPTETVYGLAADSTNAEAVASIYRTKGRPDFNPLIVHIPDVEAAKQLARFDARAERLATAFWPGPLTLVVPKREDCPVVPAVTAGLDTIALRCPAHPVMRELLDLSGLYLAAPSANRSGAISPTTADHVRASLGDRVPMIIDGGACEAGIESTIVALDETGWRLLRPGPVTVAELSRSIGEPLPEEVGHIQAPGQLASHYAPSKPVRLNAETADGGEFLIGFKELEGDLNLSEGGDLAQAAAALFAALHVADASDKAAIAVAPIPDHGIGLAINDRLSRAAHR